MIFSSFAGQEVPTKRRRAGASLYRRCAASAPWSATICKSSPAPIVRQSLQAYRITISARPPAVISRISYSITIRARCRHWLCETTMSWPRAVDARDKLLTCVASVEKISARAIHATQKPWRADNRQYWHAIMKIRDWPAWWGEMPL